MKKGVNKFGLSRYIDAGIRRQIRKQCGYGCVICGLGIYTYEHVDPEFSEAKEHNPDKIVLLCGSCHLKVTKGIWSKEKVKVAMKNPRCLQQEFSHDYFDVGDPFGVNLGRIYFYQNKTGELFKINDKLVLKLESPNDGPPKLSGSFYDTKGSLLFEIVENEWIGKPEAWDIEAVGRRLTIREKNRKILLQIHAKPPHIISIEKIDLNYEGNSIISDERSGKILLKTVNGASMDASTGVVVMSGPVVIENSQVRFENGSMVVLGGTGMSFKPLDFEQLLKTGRMSS